MDFLSNQFFRKQAEKFSRRFFLPRPVPPAVHFLKIQQNSHSVVKCGSAAAGRSGCAVERAAGAVLPDAPPGQETGVTVSWEEICLPVSGQSGCPWQAAGDDPGLPAQAGGIFPLSAPGQAGHGADAGGLAALPAEGGLLPRHGQHPHLSGQRPAGLSGPAGPAADRPAGHRRGDPAGADQGGVSAPADHGADPGTGAHLSAGEDIRPDGAAGRGTGPDDGRGGGRGPGLCR